MGILDQLRDEANKKKADIDAESNLGEQRANRYRHFLLPKMQEIFQYMKEIIEHLNFLEQDIEINHYSDRYQQLGLLHQKGYKINTDGYDGFVNPENIMQINISFNCQGEGDFVFQKEGKSFIEQEVSFLIKSNTPFQWKYIQSAENASTAVFRVKRNIPVQFRFEVDYEQSLIILLIKNHANFDFYKKNYSPEEIDQDLLDKIARYMLRKDDDLVRLEISTQQKTAIKQQLKKQRREHEALMQQIAMEEAQQEKEDDKNIFDRLNPLKKPE